MTTDKKTTIFINISPSLKRRFKARCARRGITMTKRLEELLAQDCHPTVGELISERKKKP